MGAQYQLCYDVGDGTLAGHGEKVSEATAFPQESFAELAKLEAGHFWFEARNDLILWAIAKYAPEAKTLIEIGCGTGFVLSGIRQRFPHMELAGGELYEDGLTIARDRLPGVHLSQIDARNMRDSGRWDAVGAFDVIEHILEDDAALAGMYEALKPGGTLLVTVPQHMWLWSAIDEASFHQRRYSRRQLADRVRASGFRVQRVTSFVSLLLPLMFAGRLRKKKAVADLQEEFKIPERLNRILRRVMRVEFALIRTGVPMLAGGSLLLIARKP